MEIKVILTPKSEFGGREIEKLEFDSKELLEIYKQGVFPSVTLDVDGDIVEFDVYEATPYCNRDLKRRILALKKLFESKTFIKNNGIIVDENYLIYLLNCCTDPIKRANPTGNVIHFEAFSKTENNVLCVGNGSPINIKFFIEESDVEKYNINISDFRHMGPDVLKTNLWPLVSIQIIITFIILEDVGNIYPNSDLNQISIANYQIGLA